MNYTKARNICSLMGEPCEFATNLGLCESTGCRKHMVTNGTRTIEYNPPTAVLAKTCYICEKAFDIWSPQDPRTICPECLKRLNRILYPEREKE